MSQCPLFLSLTHDTYDYFNTIQIPAQFNITNLWKNPSEVAEKIQEWKSRLAFLNG